MTPSIDLAPSRPEYRTSTLLAAVLLLTGMIAVGTCLGVVAAFEADRIIHAADYAE